ncbi:MAG: ABC transporter ATP-binding protein [Planctomycetota bacterium]|jgi:putative ABC transport system ATP-binding protein
MDDADGLGAAAPATDGGGTGTGPLIVARGVTKTFTMGLVEVPVLRGVDLEIPRRALTVILGPSGSGKSTLLNLVGGIDRPTGGRLLFDGDDLAARSDRELTAYRREHVGFVFQFYNLVPSLTALENVLVAAELVAAPRDAGELLELVGLADRRDHFPAQLSGGEQQRVATARALVKDPVLLLCDEPTGALDRDTGRHVLGVLQRLGRELDKTVVLVTHNTAISAIADRVVRIGSGVIEDVTDQPAPVPADEITW